MTKLMAILKGFPPSQTISPGIRIPDMNGITKVLGFNSSAGTVLIDVGTGPVWASQGRSRQDGAKYPIPNIGDEVEYSYFKATPHYIWYEHSSWNNIVDIKVISN